MEFRQGPLAGQTQRVESEPGEVFEVPPERGGPFTYVRVVSVGAETSAEPVRLIYDPAEPVVSQFKNFEETMANQKLPGARRWRINNLSWSNLWRSKNRRGYPPDR